MMELAYGDGDSILEYLARLGFQLENNRAKGGRIWVYLGKAEFGRVAEHLVKSGVEAKHNEGGRRKRLG